MQDALRKDLVGLLAEASNRDELWQHGATALLPLLACEAAGGRADQAVPASAAWRALDMAGKVMDDVQDGDALRATGSDVVSRLIQVATGYYAMSMLCLTRLPSDVYIDASGELQRAILKMVGGQDHGSVLVGVDGVRGTLETAGATSGRLLALAAWLGARCATSEPKVIGRLSEFGLNSGILLQLLDDLVDFRAPGDEGDLAVGRRTLPVLYSLEVATASERARLEQLLRLAREDAGAESDARELMIALGAEAYMWAEIERYRLRAMGALEASGVAREGISALERWLSGLQEGALCA